MIVFYCTHLNFLNIKQLNLSIKNIFFSNLVIYFAEIYYVYNNQKWQFFSFVKQKQIPPIALISKDREKETERRPQATESDNDQGFVSSPLSMLACLFVFMFFTCSLSGQVDETSWIQSV